MEFVSVINRYIFYNQGLLSSAPTAQINVQEFIRLRMTATRCDHYLESLFHPTFEGVSEIVSDIFGKRGDDDVYDLNFIKSELTFDPYAVSYDSYILDRVQSYSEVSEEQLRDRESATAVEEETCTDPSPSVSSSGVPGTSGMNYQLMITFTILTL